MAPESCAMGLSSVRVDTGGGGCVQTKMRFFTIFGEIGADFGFTIYEEEANRAGCAVKLQASFSLQ